LFRECSFDKITDWWYFCLALPQGEKRMSTITIRKFDVSRDIEDLIRLWGNKNIQIWNEFISIGLARAHMLDMSHGFDDVGGLDLVAEREGFVVGIGWAATFSISCMRGTPVMYALGVEPSDSDGDPTFFNLVTEKMLEFAREEIRGDKNVGRLSGMDGSDIRT